jgi:hypothetical protein
MDGKLHTFDELIDLTRRQPGYDMLVEATSKSVVQHVDETGWKIGGRLRHGPGDVIPLATFAPACTCSR